MPTVFRRIRGRSHPAFREEDGPAGGPPCLVEGRESGAPEAGARRVSRRIPEGLPAVHGQLLSLRRLYWRARRVQEPEVREAHAGGHGRGRLRDCQEAWLSDRSPYEFL